MQISVQCKVAARFSRKPRVEVDTPRRRGLESRSRHKVDRHWDCTGILSSSSVGSSQSICFELRIQPYQVVLRSRMAVPKPPRRSLFINWMGAGLYHCPVPRPVSPKSASLETVLS